jgi:hypothetical protein
VNIRTIGGSVTIHFTITTKRIILVYSDLIFLPTKVQKGKTIQQVDREQPVMSVYVYHRVGEYSCKQRGQGEEA